MKRTIGALIIFAAYSFAHLQAQTTASFNFSLGSQSVVGWNNVAGDPATGARSATDQTTGITVTSVGPSNWAGYNGSSAIDGAGLAADGFFPGTVLQNMWYQYNSYFSGYSAATPQLVIGGLNSGSVYTITISCSFTVAVRNIFNLSPTRYAVAGLSVVGYQDVNCNSNTTAGATFNNVAPDAAGNIRIYVNTLSYTSVAGISGLQVTTGQ